MHELRPKATWIVVPSSIGLKETTGPIPQSSDNSREINRSPILVESQLSGLLLGSRSFENQLSSVLLGS